MGQEIFFFLTTDEVGTTELDVLATSGCVGKWQVTLEPAHGTATPITTSNFSFHTSNNWFIILLASAYSYTCASCHKMASLVTHPLLLSCDINCTRSIDVTLNWQLFSDVGRPRSFVDLMSTNSTLDPVSTVLCRMPLQLCSYVNMNFGSVRSTRVKLWQQANLDLWDSGTHNKKTTKKWKYNTNTNV